MRLLQGVGAGGGCVPSREAWKLQPNLCLKCVKMALLLHIIDQLGWKGPRASMNIWQRTVYSPKPFISGLKFMESFQPCTHSNLRNLGCSILDRGPQQTSFTVETPLSHFFHARSHALSPGCRVQLSVNCTRLPKPLKNVKSRTATTSLHGPFHPVKPTSWGRGGGQIIPVAPPNLKKTAAPQAIKVDYVVAQIHMARR